MLLWRPVTKRARRKKRPRPSVPRQCARRKRPPSGGLTCWRWCRDLLPKDFDRKGKTTKDILVAAAGDEIPDAAERSEDYLQAKIETILERRKPDGQGALQNRADDASATGDPMGAHAIYRLREAS